MPMIPPFSHNLGELTPYSTGSPMRRPYCFVILPNGNFKSTSTKQKSFYSLDADLFLPVPLHFQHNVIPWNTQVRYPGLLLDSKLLFTRHLTSVIHKATGISSNFSPSSHAIQHYPSPINSLCTNYVFNIIHPQ